MMRRTFAAILILAVYVSFGGASSSQANAQDRIDSALQSDTGTTTDVAESEAESDVRPASEQIQQHLKDGEPAKAARILSSALEANTEDAQLRRLHRSVAMGFLRARKYEDATGQLRQWFQYELPRTDSPKAANSLAGIVQQMSVYGVVGNQADAIAKATEQAIARCRELEADYPIEIQSALAKLVGLRGTALSRDDKPAARDLMDRELEKLKSINSSGDVNVQTISAEISLLTLSARLFDDSASEARLESLFKESLQAYPKSESLAVQFASHEYSVISGLSRDKPEVASRRKEDAVAKLTPLAEEFRGVQSILRRIEGLESRIEAGRKMQALIGKPAPPLDVDGWVNTKIESVDDLKGKVVLYDFWAIWCGPCIATFPHLREWREEFGDQGFEIVGITRYYGYSWDDESNQAVRSSKDLSAEVERDAVGKFLQSKDMQHPTILTPKDSQLQKDYGVTGIPHAVLIDRQGNVQMIKVGSGQANADALHAKIKELVAN